MEIPTDYGWSLGLRVGTSADIIKRVERGFSTAAADRLAKRLGLNRAELAQAIGISVRTLTRRRRQGKFAQEESDRLYRLARLFERAATVFTSEDEARLWFHQPQWGLGGASPLAYSQTDPGAQEVETLLERIDIGILA